MELKKEQQNELEKIVKEYSSVFGREALKGLYNLNKTINQNLGNTSKRLPVLAIYRILLKEDLDTKYKGMSVKQIAQAENVPVRTIYYFYHQHFKIKRNKK